MLEEKGIDGELHGRLVERHRAIPPRVDLLAIHMPPGGWSRDERRAASAALGLIRGS